MKRVIAIGVLLCGTTLIADEEQSYNVGFKASTLGVGFDISKPISEKMSARFNLNGGDFNYDETFDENDYDMDMELLTAGILLDYYPYLNNFRLTTGLYYNENQVSGVASSSSTISRVVSSYSNVAKVNIDTESNEIAPYIGLGWGNNSHSKGWGVTFDLGLMYYDAEVTLSPSVQALSNVAVIDSALQEEEDSINDDLDSFPFYPVVSLGLNYSF